MMKITNKHNLPSSLVNIASDDEHITLDKHFGVTSLLNPIRITILKRRYGKDIEIDVSEMVWVIFGQAVHKIAEQHDTTGNAEVEVRWEIRDGYFLRGKIDLYNEEQATIEDYKTCSAYKVAMSDFEDWKLQGLMYAFLLRKHGKYVEKLRFHALLKDWKASKKFQENQKGNFYPDRPIWTWEHTISTYDMVEIEKFIRQRFEEIIASEQIPDDQLTLCTPEERWNTGDKWAVQEKYKKYATRVLDTKEQAELYIIKKGLTNAEIVFRKGEDERCNEYCLVKSYCSYFKNKKEGE